jgi:hypothetical protein
MKNTILLSAPTAKLQIGNQITATIDTASKNGKKSYQINIETQDDTITQNIDNAIEEVKNEVMDIKSSIADAENEVHTEIREPEEPRYDRAIDKAVPIFMFICIFGYLAFRSFQKRKWMEALLNKGVNPEEIKKLSTSNEGLKIFGDNKVENFEKQRMLKYSIIFGSFGLAVLIGTTMEEFGYFIGFLFLFLGTGFWYYNNKVN